MKKLVATILITFSALGVFAATAPITDPVEYSKQKYGGECKIDSEKGSETVVFCESDTEEDVVICDDRSSPTGCDLHYNVPTHEECYVYFNKVAQDSYEFLSESCEQTRD